MKKELLQQLISHRMALQGDLQLPENYRFVSLLDNVISHWNTRYLELVLNEAAKQDNSGYFAQIQNILKTIEARGVGRLVTRDLRSQAQILRHGTNEKKRQTGQRHNQNSPNSNTVRRFNSAAPVLQQDSKTNWWKITLALTVGFGLGYYYYKNRKNVNRKQSNSN